MAVETFCPQIARSTDIETDPARNDHGTGFLLSVLNMHFIAHREFKSEMARPLDESRLPQSVSDKG